MDNNHTIEYAWGICAGRRHDLAGVAGIRLALNFCLKLLLTKTIFRLALNPQLTFIHIHQLFRIHYTWFKIDTVNIYWWWCINYCRVLKLPALSAPYFRLALELPALPSGVAGIRLVRPL